MAGSNERSYPNGAVAIDARLRALMASGLEGDRHAYEAFLRELGAYLAAFFRRRLARLPDEVEDLVQETLLAVHVQRHHYQPGQPLTPWVHAIARYKMVDMLRRWGNHEALHDPLDDDSGLPAVPAMQAVDAQRDIGCLLGRLPDSQRLPIECVKLKGFSVAETASLTGFSESAVKVGVHRGLKALASLFEKSKL